jgi:hypothetical protein
VAILADQSVLHASLSSWISLRSSLETGRFKTDPVLVASRRL